MNFKDGVFITENGRGAAWFGNKFLSCLLFFLTTVENYVTVFISPSRRISHLAWSFSSGLSHLRMITLITFIMINIRTYNVRYTCLSLSIRFSSITFYFFYKMISCTHVHHFRSVFSLTSLCHLLYKTLSP